MDGAQEMAEGVVYTDIYFPPPAPTAALQRLPSSWQRVALGLALLCILLLAALLGLGLHRPEGSCVPERRSMEETLEQRMQQRERFLTGRWQFCPAGWLWDAGKCYYLAKKDWAKSKEDCCSQGAELVTIRANATLDFLQRESKSNTFHMGLRKERAGLDWKWVDGSALNRLFPVMRSTASYLACGRVLGHGLSGGSCTDPGRWICEQSVLTLQWGHGSAPPTFLWGNTTYTHNDPSRAQSQEPAPGDLLPSAPGPPPVPSTPVTHTPPPSGACCPVSPPQTCCPDPDHPNEGPTLLPPQVPSCPGPALQRVLCHAQSTPALAESDPRAGARARPGPALTHEQQQLLAQVCRLAQTAAAARPRVWTPTSP